MEANPLSLITWIPILANINLATALVECLRAQLEKIWRKVRNWNFTKKSTKQVVMTELAILEVYIKHNHHLLITLIIIKVADLWRKTKQVKVHKIKEIEWPGFRILITWLLGITPRVHRYLVKTSLKEPYAIHLALRGPATQMVKEFYLLQSTMCLSPRN